MTEQHSGMARNTWKQGSVNLLRSVFPNLTDKLKEENSDWVEVGVTANVSEDRDNLNTSVWKKNQ